MPNVSSFGAQTDNAVVSGTVTDRQMIIPEVPPQGLMSVGPRVTPNFIKEPWSKLRSYNFFDVVKDVAGSSYIAIKPVVPTNTELTDEEFWFKWSDPGAQLNELQEIVKTYNERISKNASAITAEVARATAAEATKAPVNHASEETVYGIGNAANYGHLKLADDDTPMTSDANAGIAATPKTVLTHARFNFPFENGGYLLNFGDSIAAGSQATTSYAKIIAEKLNLELKDFAVGGALISTSGTGAQINKAVAQVTEKEKVRVILYEGGVNNTYNSVDAFPYEQAHADLSKLKEAYPHAFIVCIPLIWSAYPFAIGDSITDKTDSQTYSTTGNNRVNCLYAISQAANEIGVMCIDNIYECLIGYRNYFTNFIHPNDKGHSRLASWIMQSLVGGKATRTIENCFDKTTIDPGEYFDLYQFTVSCVNSIVTVRGGLKCKKQLESDTIAKIIIPSHAAFGNSESMIVPIFNYTSKKIVPAWTSGYDEYIRGVISISPTETINVGDKLFLTPLTYKIGCA